MNGNLHRPAAACMARRLLFAVLLAGSLAGCASSAAPAGWLPTAAEAQRHAFGAWIEVSPVATDTTLNGELIALDSNAVVVLSPEALHRLAWSKLAEARLFAYDTRYGQLSTWTGFGTLSALSHGSGLLLSAPAWLVAGSAATSQRSYHAAHDVSGENGAALRRFARFPQGLPAGVVAGDLRRSPPSPAD